MTSLEDLVKRGFTLTPMLNQYYKIKSANKDSILLFRMGDFYEVFFEDAKLVSKVLNIALTTRGKVGDTKIPMAGIPFHAAPQYVDQLTNAGYRVAICEQVENPKKAKGIVKRAVTQVVSPGIPYNLDSRLSPESRYIASIGISSKEEKPFSLVLLDYTTGDFLGMTFPDSMKLIEALVIYSPKELVKFPKQYSSSPLLSDFLDKNDITASSIAPEHFKYAICKNTIEKFVPNFESDPFIKNLESLKSALSGLSNYVEISQNSDDLCHLHPFKLIDQSESLGITSTGLIGLEILPSQPAHYKRSLLGFMDKTLTGMGKRKLKEVFASPLMKKENIISRQNIVGHFVENPDDLDLTRKNLDQVRDLERILAKISSHKFVSQDLFGISGTINAAFELLPLFSKPIFSSNSFIPSNILGELKKLATEIDSTFHSGPGISWEKGNFVKKGVSAHRDKLAGLYKNSDETLKNFEKSLQNESGISKLKIKSNNVFGYFIEVPKGQVDKVPQTYTRKQTLTNAERYTHPELRKLEDQIVSAEGALKEVEYQIFTEFMLKISANSAPLRHLAKTLALVDVYQSLGLTSYEEKFSRPKISEDKSVSLTQAFHPLLRENLKGHVTFHDILIDSKDPFVLLTGPNMAGKTTVMREIAIAQILFQIGSYVPAEAATLSICDFLFSRLGANDNITEGQSTFMVEMSESAQILRHATQRSLILLDEVGRGTSTYDGLAIAWSLVLHLVQKTKAMTIFSTHYHELVDVVEELSGAKNWTVKTVEENGKVHFLYEIIDGGAKKSFGINVAKLAGLPTSVLTKASQILNNLENDNPVPEKTSNTVKETAQSNQLSLFSEKSRESTIISKEELSEIDINSMTPIDAFKKLNDWIQRVH